VEELNVVAELSNRKAAVVPAVNEHIPAVTSPGTAFTLPN